jgi:leader peptidase (prepilin peptidase)/N-methyltransferase
VRLSDGDLWLSLALLVLLVPITRIDITRRIIPNAITGPGAALALILGAIVDPGGLPEQILAGLAAALFLLVPALLHPAGMGMGDVKLAGMMGLFLGRAVAVALLAALLAGALVGMGIVARRGVRAGRRSTVPFGAFLAFGGAVAVLAGPAILDAYLDSIG